MKRFQVIPITVVAALAMAACDKADDKKPAAEKAAPDKPAATTPAAGDVTMVYVTEPAGMSWSEADTMSMTAKLTAEGEELPLFNTETKKKQITVIATTPKAATKAKITYSDYQEAQVMGPRERSVGDEVVGKTYILEYKDGKVLVTQEDGKAPSAEEIELVINDNKNFGKPAPMGIALEGTVFKMGEKKTIPPEQLSTLFGGDDGRLKAGSIDMTLTEMRGTNAVFAMDVELEGKSGPMTIGADLQATVLVDPTTTRLHDLKLEGTMTFSGGATGTGTMTGHKSATY